MSTTLQNDIREFADQLVADLPTVTVDDVIGAPSHVPNGAPVAPAGTFNADPTALIPLPLGEAPVVFPGLAAVPAAEAGLVQDIPTVQARWRLALAGAGLAGVDTLVVVAPLR